MTADPNETFGETCNKDYVVAEITVVGRQKKGVPDSLLLAVVELLHPWLERDPNVGHPPQAGGFPRFGPSVEGTGTLYIQRWHLPVSAALDWYRGALSGSVLVPGYSTRNQNPRPEAVAVANLGEDPVWPRMAVEVEPFWQSVTEFWGKRPGGSRWHRLIPLVPPPLLADWKAGEIARAHDWLYSELHFDLLSRSVLHGSLHLVLPNPCFRDVSVSVQDDWSSVVFDTEPWPGHRAERCDLIVWNRRAGGASSVAHLDISSGHEVVTLSEGVEEVAHAVVCPYRGLLHMTSGGVFLAAIGLAIGIDDQEREVEVPPRSPKGSPKRYKVPVAGAEHEVYVGMPRPPSALRRLNEDLQRTREHATWSAFAIQWFERKSDEGKAAVQEVIGGARKSLALLDPYFGAADLMEFALATRTHGLPVRILTSAAYCEGIDEPTGLEQGALLQRMLANVLRQDPSLKIEVKVMRGAKSPVHDRFLIVDRTVWLLGASLNEFGDRGTLLMKLPDTPRNRGQGQDPVSIVDGVFERFWGETATVVESLGDFVSRRARERTTRSLAERLQSVAARFKKFLGGAARDLRA